mmetsp:Transcript_12173/g.11008  ORF Transcript_12173/g.11008 Transcript_12173/m.11008 type:complete len:336 (-) Transcript_12173:223-1230(-)
MTSFNNNEEYNLSFEYQPNDGDKSDDINNIERIEKSRERNREHAKKTRLRKKIMLEGLKNRLLELQNEATRLQQAYEESNTANILLHLGANPNENNITTLGSLPLDDGHIIDPSILSKGNIIDQLRSNVRAEAAQFKRNYSSQSSTHSSNMISSLNSLDNNHFNKSESFDQYSDALSEGSVENDHLSLDDPVANKRWRNGNELTESNMDKKASIEEMDIIRKERNRMHAKLTRDRKKLFTSRLQQLVNSLERQNTIMKMKLQNSGKEDRINSKPPTNNIPKVEPERPQVYIQNMMPNINVNDFHHQYQFFQQPQFPNMYNNFYYHNDDHENDNYE